MIETIFGIPMATALGAANLGVGTANLIATSANRKEIKDLAVQSHADHKRIYNVCERVDMGIEAQSKLLQDQTNTLKAQTDNMLALNQRLFPAPPVPNQYQQQYYQQQQNLANQANVYNQTYNPTQQTPQYPQYNNPFINAGNCLTNYCQQQAQNARIDMLTNEIRNLAASVNKPTMQPVYPMYQQPTMASASPTFTNDQFQTLLKHITG